VSVTLTPIATITQCSSRLSLAINKDTALIRDFIPTLQASVSSIQMDQDRAQLSALKEWISPRDFIAQQSDVLRRRHEGTGKWFLRAPEFVHWLDRSRPDQTLFCVGMPGAGKTMLAAAVIDHVSRTLRSSTIGVAWLYCNYKSFNEHTFDVPIAGIAQQLVQADNLGSIELIKRLQQQHDARNTRPTDEEWKELLLGLAAKFDSIYLVVDALDESDLATRQKLRHQLNAIRGMTDLRLLVTSRDIPEIVEDFRTASKIQIRAHDEDVRSFIAGQIDSLPKCIRQDGSLQYNIQERIVEATDGM
jgi:hypothetical protein